MTRTKPDYGIDAPNVMRNLFLSGLLCLLLAIFLPQVVHIGTVSILTAPSFGWPAFWLLLGACLFLLYVKFGKLRHRDFMLSMHTWRGNEQVLDVGCGRGLLLVGAAKHLNAGGQATGIDMWSNIDMGGNSEAATQKNLDLEGVASRCKLVTGYVQEAPFADASFDVIVSNLCLHNIYDRSTRLKALDEIVRVLKPGGLALISDYKRTGEYASVFANRGLQVKKRWGSFLTTFPPLRVIVARKPG
jgi:arsenite methyltransferase